MTIGNGQWSIETILQLVYDGREGEALAAIRTKLGTDGELRFSTTADAPDVEPEPERPHRVRLANLYSLSVYLMDKELWDQAVKALSLAVQCSVDMEEVFFLEDCHFRRALCYKLLGRVDAWYRQLTADTVAVAHGGTARALMVALGIETPLSACDLTIEQGAVYMFGESGLTKYS